MRQGYAPCVRRWSTKLAHANPGVSQQGRRRRPRGMHPPAGIQPLRLGPSGADRHKLYSHKSLIFRRLATFPKRIPRPKIWETIEAEKDAKCLFYLVGAPRFELGTPSPPDWCANRAALRSEAVNRPNFAGSYATATPLATAWLATRSRRSHVRRCAAMSNFFNF